jgi:hypothetical protein
MSPVWMFLAIASAAPPTLDHPAMLRAAHQIAEQRLADCARDLATCRTSITADELAEAFLRGCTSMLNHPPPQPYGSLVELPVTCGRNCAHKNYNPHKTPVPYLSIGGRGERG